MEKSPKISIITVSYNAVETIEETILSVINQSNPNFEYIIIDGGSIDGTVDIIKKYQNKIDYWISEPDKGIYDAWNKGIQQASGEWIMFLGGDDILVSCVIEKYSNIFHRVDDSVDYISGRCLLMTEDMKPIKEYGEPYDWNIFRHYMNVVHPGSLHRRRLFLEVGIFDIQYKSSGDYELLLRKRNKLKTSYICELVVFMRIGGTSFSIQGHIESYRIKRKYKTETLPLSLFHLIKGIFGLYVKKILWT